MQYNSVYRNLRPQLIHHTMIYQYTLQLSQNIKSVDGEPLEPLGRLPARCTQWQWHPALHERVEVHGTTSGARDQVMAAKQKNRVVRV